ncbi:MAG: PQQ-binding-like beta-propeller repeat protein [Planctomycetia bacterium]|nr:PQQ-binding-like beta-propeller repeat protein [Planctomycetia bacterium]
MKRITLVLATSLLAVGLLAGADWRQFRGTDNNPVSEEPAPERFDLATGENVAWNVPLVGRGPSSPIVVGNQVIVTCSSGPRQDRLHVLAVDTASGKRNWHRQFWATGQTLVNSFGAVAQPTPASDGRLVFAFYSSNDLACFDLDGNPRWLRGLAFENPTTRNDAGMSSSPLVVGPTVIVQLENQGASFVEGIDTGSGETRWRIERDRSGIWSSPTLLRGKTPAEDAVLLVGRDRLSAHDPQTGKQLWQYAAECHTISSPVGHDGRAYLPAWGLDAIEYDAAAGQSRLLWRQPRMAADNASPVIAGGRAYVIKGGGILVCGDLADGNVAWQLRLAGPFWATPVVAAGRLYAVNYDGLVHVVELGEKGKLLAKCQFDARILATPAVADGAIYLRSDEHLCKIAGKAKSGEPKENP